MLKKALPLVLLLSSTSYSGQLKSIDFLYSSKSAGDINRSYLEITLVKSGDCSVSPVVKKGKEIVVDLNNCQIERPYLVGKRGNFVKQAELLPEDKSSKLVVDLYKPGVLKLSRRGSAVKLKILEGGFVNPEFNSLKTLSGEEIVIDFPVPVKPTFEKVGNRLILQIPGIRLEPSRQRISAFYVTSARLSNTKKGGVITLSLSPSVLAVEVLPKGNQIFVKLMASKNRNRSSASSVSVQGPKVALHFTNADVKSVVRAIASVAGVNVVFDPEVRGKVNVDFKNPVPWKEALKAVLEPLSLTYIETPDYIRILPKSKILKEQKLEPVNDYIVPINYVNAADLVKDITKLLGKSEREKITVNKQTNSLLLKVTPTHYSEILRLIKSIDKPRKQVLVKAKIVQLSSKAEKDLGFTWYISGYNHFGNPASSSYVTGSYGFNTNNYSPLISPDTYMNYSNIPVMNSTLALGILNSSQTLRVELALKALEIDGEAQVISSPKVLTLDNQEATIEQGIEIPYREATVAAGGATTYSINFKKASLILKVKPHITSDNNILLDLELHKDSPNYDYVAITGNGEPAINTRNVKSKVLVHNGDTIVIGGIYEKDKNRSVSGVPVLSRIPLLGWLFKNSQTTVSKQEMIVFITPFIVNSNGEK